MARPKKIKTTTLNDLGEFLTKTEVKEKPKIVEKIVPHQQLIDEGFSFDVLPSGRINMNHKLKFRVNGCMGSYGRGLWTYTLGCEMKDLTTYVKSVKFE